MGERVGQIAKVPEVKQSNSNSRVRRTKRLQSMDTPMDRILYLQRTAGNQAVSRLMKSGALQAKLRIGQPGDVYEQEADRVADAVMQMPEPEVQRQVDPEEETLQSKPLAGQITPLVQVQRQEETEEEEEEETLNAKPLTEEINPLVQRQVEPEEEEEKLQAKATSAHISEANPSLGSKVHSLRRGGQPLSENDRAYFEPRFGRDFSQVRVHTDAQAARAVNARAFTVGQDVVFGTGQYAPAIDTGRQLLAHELTHVVQQQALSRTLMIQRQPVRGDLATRAELEADGFNWHLSEVNLSSGRRRPFIMGGLMVSGKGYSFGIKFSSNCPQSLVQTVITRGGYFSAKGRSVGRQLRRFVEMFRVEGGKAVGIDVHSHPTPSPRYLKSRGIRGAVSHCLEKELVICCGNFAGRTVPRGRRSITLGGQYRPQKINCLGPQFTYKFNYCTNGRDFTFRVTSFPINISSFQKLPRNTGLVATIAFTVDMMRRLNRHGISGAREVDRYIIIDPGAKLFVQKKGVDGAEALFFAQGEIVVARRFLSNLKNVRMQYDNCLTAVISRPGRTLEQWSFFVRHQLRKPKYGLCSMKINTSKKPTGGRRP